MAKRSDRSVGFVLIIEDEPLVAMFLTDQFDDVGRPVVGPVSSREAALRSAAATPPAVAIVDINLGSAGDGISLAKELQEAHGTAIIFLSGYADMAANDAVVAVNPVAVLQKPCASDDLIAALEASEW
jgi:two-component system, response regulator PdtaR